MHAIYVQVYAVLGEIVSELVKNLQSASYLWSFGAPFAGNMEVSVWFPFFFDQ